MCACLTKGWKTRKTEKTQVDQADLWWENKEKRGKQWLVHEYKIDWRLENKENGENMENRGLYMNTWLTDSGKTEACIPNH